MRCFKMIVVLVMGLWLTCGSLPACGIVGPTGTQATFTFHPGDGQVTLQGLWTYDAEDLDGDGVCNGDVYIANDPLGLASFDEMELIQRITYSNSCGGPFPTIYLDPALLQVGDGYEFLIGNLCHDNYPPCCPGLPAVQIRVNIHVDPYRTDGLVARVVTYEPSRVALSWSPLESGTLPLSHYRIYSYPEPFDFTAILNGDPTFEGSVDASFTSLEIGTLPSGSYPFFMVVGETANGQLVAISDCVRLIDCANHHPTVTISRFRAGDAPQLSLLADAWDRDGDPLSYSWDILQQPTGAFPVLTDPQAGSTEAILDMDGLYEFRVRVSDPYDGISEAYARYEKTDAPSPLATEVFPTQGGLAHLSDRTLHEDFYYSYFDWGQGAQILCLVPYAGAIQAVADSVVCTMRTMYGTRWAVGDIDGDGMDDFALGDSSYLYFKVIQVLQDECADDLPVRKSLVTAYTSPIPSSQSDQYTVKIRDADDDGDGDVLITTTGNSTVAHPYLIVNRNEGNFTFTSLGFSLSPSGGRYPLWFLEMGHFFSSNAAEHTELAVGLMDNAVHCYTLDFATQTARETGIITLPIPVNGLWTADLNQDHRDDFIYRSTTTPAALYGILSNDSGGYGDVVPLSSTMSSILKPAVVDWNGDGCPDLVLGDETNRSMTILWNDPAAPGTFSTESLPEFTFPVDPTAGAGLVPCGRENDLVPSLFYNGIDQTGVMIHATDRPVGCLIEARSPRKGVAPYHFQVGSRWYAEDGTIPVFEWRVAETGDTYAGETADIQLCEPGTYSILLTVRDSRNRSWTDRVAVFVEPGVHPLITGPDSLCLGDSVTLDAGAGYVAYRWSTGETTRTITVSPTADTTYTVDVTPIEGCSPVTSPSHAVTVYPLPQAVISGPDTVCAGQWITLEFTGSGYSRFIWSDGSTENPHHVQPTADTAYTVTVTNDQGCSFVSEPHQVTLIDLPAVAISGESETCTGESVVLDAGAGYTSYEWSTGETTQMITVNPTVREGFDNYDGSEDLIINVDFYFDVTGDCGFYLYDESPDHDCNPVFRIEFIGGVLYLTDSNDQRTTVAAVYSRVRQRWTHSEIRYNAVAQTVSYQFQNWEINLVADNVDFVIQPFRYLGVGRVSGTFAIDNVAIATEGTSGRVLYTEDFSSDPQYQSLSPASVFWASAWGDYYFVPETYPTGEPWAYSREFRAYSQSQRYTVAVTSDTGCNSLPATHTITVHPWPRPVISGADTSCAGESVTLYAGDGYASYLWSTGETTPMITVMPTQTTTYTVTVTGDGDCTATSPSHQILVTGSCPGDLDGDGDVGSGDLILLGQYLCRNIPDIPAGWPAGDCNGDGVVNAVDLAVLIRNMVNS